MSRPTMYMPGGISAEISSGSRDSNRHELAFCRKAYVAGLHFHVEWPFSQPHSSDTFGIFILVVQSRPFAESILLCFSSVHSWSDLFTYFVRTRKDG